MGGHRARRGAAVVGLAVAALAMGLRSAGPVDSLPRWAPAATASIHPGAVLVTDGAQCTANFVFTRNDEVFLGYAAHCAGTGGATDLDGCATGSLPLGTPVEIEGARRPGVLVYSSWLAMQVAKERNANACAYNDFALVRVDPVDRGAVNPSVPHWGGPTGLNRTGNPGGASVFTYGSSSLRQGLTALSPKSGFSVGTDGGGWTHPVYTLTPGIPGDSGSGLLDGSGKATGILSTVNITPLPASNSFGDLQRSLAYARVHGMGNVVLAVGTQPFDPDQLPLG
jgi:hypothetical protein